jgi:hypothetical protein
MNPLQRMNIEEWIGALRSGEYQKNRAVLHRGDSFCALGVLADTQGVEWVTEDTEERDECIYGFRYGSPSCRCLACTGGNFWDASVPEDLFQEWTGLGSQDAGDIIRANDDHNLSFDDIADLIKQKTNRSD